MQLGMRGYYWHCDLSSDRAGSVMMHFATLDLGMHLLVDWKSVNLLCMQQ